MAISKEIWGKARTLYESNQFSLSQISERTGIDKSSISKKAKIQQWSSVENLDYIEAKTTLAVKKSKLNQQEINTLDEVADEVVRRQNLVYGFQEKAIKRAGEILEMTEAAQDLKHLVDAVDKASITLKVSDRHAPKTEINNTNATQNNTDIKRVTIARRSDRDN